MRVTYAINARLAGGGIGNIAYHAARAIQACGWLDRLLVSSSKTHEFDRANIVTQGLIGRAMKRVANYDPTNQLYSLGDAVFDAWAARQIPTCDIFHGWNNHALASVSAAKRHGAVTIIERGGSHILQSVQLISEEAERWGTKQRHEVSRTISRCLREYDAADYILLPSQYNVDSFTARGFDPERLLLLPMGVDVEKFRPRWDLPERPFRVLFVGQVTIRKGIGYVLEAWKRARLPIAELVVAGEIKADAEPLVAPHRSDPTIHWLGFVSDSAELYRSSHVFLFPTVDEGSALVTYEAMASGLASIVTHNSGSLIRNTVDGYVVPLGDTDAIVEKLRRLYSDSAERIALGMAARKAITQRTWDAYGDSLLQIYERCLGMKH